MHSLCQMNCNHRKWNDTVTGAVRAIIVEAKEVMQARHSMPCHPI